jgi:hypothetical protein
MADEFPTMIEYTLIPVEGREQEMLNELAKLSHLCEVRTQVRIVVNKPAGKVDVDKLLKQLERKPH